MGSCRILVAIGLLLGWTVPAGAAGVFDDLVRQVAPDANVLVLVDADRIRRSAFAKQQALQDNDGADEANSHVVPRKDVSLLVQSARIRGFRDSLVDWEAALINLHSAASLESTAANYGGRMESLGKRDYVQLPTEAMIFKTGEKSLFVFSPTDRPRATRQLNLAQSSRKVALEGYLAEVYQKQGPGSDALFVIDLEDMFAPNVIQRFVLDSKTLGKQSAEALRAVKILRTLQGLTLRLKFHEQVEGELTIDFQAPVGDVSIWARDLFFEILAESGARLEDLDDWSFAAHDRQIVFKGALSMSGLRKVFTLIDLPTAIPHELDPRAELTEEQKLARSKQATLRRFRATEQLLGDLRGSKQSKSFGPGEQAVWFDKYAKKIEQLPTLYVDKDLVEYCDDIVLRLRVQATRYRMVGMSTVGYSSNSNAFWTYFGNCYSGIYTVHKQMSDRDWARRIERSAAAADKFQQFEAIDQATVEIRRLLTERYMVEF